METTIQFELRKNPGEPIKFISWAAVNHHNSG
jgi:hemolysin-activating ACP:hemolysin acyltransferase